MANATTESGVSADWRIATGMLVGYDVQGFSRFVSDTGNMHGALAGEIAADALARGEAAVSAMLANEGFSRIDSTGDGALFHSVDPPRDSTLRTLLRRCRQAYLDASGLQARFEHAAGSVSVHRMPFALEEHSDWVWGEGIARVHFNLQQGRDAMRAPRGMEMPRICAANAGDVSEQVFVFLRLLDATHWHSLETTRLDIALTRLSQWAGSLSARLDRLTHDEKGIHLRVSAPAWSGLDGWITRPATPLALLRDAGFRDACAAVAVGAVFRGPSGSQRKVVHGIAINRAAKQCAALAPGQVAIDPSVHSHRLVSRRRADEGVLVGRQDLLQQCADWLARGPSRAVILCGRPGLGKTALLKEIGVREAQGRCVASHRCAPSSTFEPFETASALLRSLLAQQKRTATDELAFAQVALEFAGIDVAFLPLAAGVLRRELVTPGLASLVLERSERRVMTERVLSALLVALSAHAPLLLAIDDLHWADPQSLSVLRAVLGREASMHLIGSWRSTSSGAESAEPMQAAWTLTLDVPPLDAREIGELVATLDCPPMAMSAKSLHAVCGGNPFHAIQAVLLLSEGGSLALGALDLTLDARLDALSNEETVALRVLALQDRDMAWDEVAAILARTDGPREADMALPDRLIRAWFVRPADDGAELNIEHQLLRDALRRRMPVGVRRRLSAAAAREAQKRRAHRAPVELAAELGRLWADGDARARAAVCYERAGRAAAAQGAYAAASTLFNHALTTAPDARRAILWHAESAAALWSLGDTEGANRSSRQATSLARIGSLGPRLRTAALTAAAVRVETGQFLGQLGDVIGGAVATARLGLNASEAQLARGRAIGSLGYLCALMRLRPLASLLYRVGEQVGRRQGNLLPSSYVLISRSIARFMHGDWDAGDLDLAQARRQLDGLKEPQLIEVMETIVGLGAHLRGDAPTALAHFRVLIAMADARGHAMHGAWGRYASAQSLLSCGDVHAAWELLSQAQALLDKVSDRQSTLICLGLRSRLAMARGDQEEAVRAAEGAGTLARTLPPTNFSSTEGYAAAPWMGLIIQRAGHTTALRDAGRRLATEHLRTLQRYALLFPIARPRLALVRSMALAVSDPRAGAAAAALAAAKADALGMRLEAVLARHVASHATASFSSKKLELY